ncbi:hypothetical protein [Methanogenium cariaci]|jgi:hypothetical protein
MDESAKQVFKMKFAKLTMVLNGIFLLAALAILAAFRVIPVYSYLIAGICGAGAIVLALYFRSAYQSDKEWLMAQGDEPEKPGSAGEQKGDNNA